MIINSPYLVYTQKMVRSSFSLFIDFNAMY